MLQETELWASSSGLDWQMQRLVLGGAVVLVVATFVAWRWMLPLWGLWRLLPCICAPHGQKTVCSLKTRSLKTLGGTAVPNCCKQAIARFDRLDALRGLLQHFRLLLRLTRL